MAHIKACGTNLGTLWVRLHAYIFVYTTLTSRIQSYHLHTQHCSLRMYVVPDAKLHDYIECISPTDMLYITANLIIMHAFSTQASALPCMWYVHLYSCLQLHGQFQIPRNIMQTTSYITRDSSTFHTKIPGNRISR